MSESDREIATRDDRVPRLYREDERHSGRSHGEGRARRRRRRRSSRESSGSITDDPFEQGIIAVGAAILFAFFLHILTPGSGFFSHLPSGWLGLFPVLLIFDRRELLNKIFFGVIYIGIWFLIAGLLNAASKGLLN